MQRHLSKWRNLSVEIYERRLAPLSTLFAAIVAIFSTLTPQSVPAQTALAVTSPVVPIALRNGSGASTFAITNLGTAPLPLVLKAGVFTDDLSHTVLPAPTVRFLSSVSGDRLPDTIASGQALSVLVDLSSVKDSTSASAEIVDQSGQTVKLANSAKPAQLQAIAIDTTLKLSIEGAGGLDKALPLLSDRPAFLTLRNGSEFVIVDYVFTVDNFTSRQQTVSLGPNGTAQIELTAPESVFHFSDRLHPSAQTGKLFLSMHAPAGIAKELLPSETLPLNLSLTWSGPFLTKLWSTGYVVVFLLFGGLLSVLATSVLPNILTKLSLRKKMGELADRTSSVSTKVDSYLRVLLRLERKKIEMALDESSPLWPTSPDVFETIDNLISTLAKRLAVAEELDELHRRFEEVSESAPPSLTDDLDRTLQLAANQIHSFVLQEDNLIVANQFLDKATQMLAMVNTPDLLAKRIATNFTQLKARLTNFPEIYYVYLKAALPGIFEILDRPFDDPKNIVQPMFFAIDHGITAMQVALDYAMVRVSVPKTPTAGGDDPGSRLRGRIFEHEPRLLELLGTLSWKALREAATLVQQMREDVYEADALREIAAKRASIIFDTQRARPYLPIFFSIKFDNEKYTSAAAISRLNFHWTFPHDLFEDGAKVCHYFDGGEDFAEDDQMTTEERARIDQEKQKQIKSQRRLPGIIRWIYSALRAGPFSPIAPRVGVVVEARRQNVSACPVGENSKVTLWNTIELQPRKVVGDRSRFLAEGMRFLIAFGVALAGLVSGALDQLAKLDFLTATVAIVSLGFGANSIKNLLTQAPATTSISPNRKP